MRRAAIAIIALSSTGCMTRLSPPVHKVQARGVVSVSAEWIKDKGDKFDMGLRVANEGERVVQIRAEDAQCYRGERRGQFRKTLAPKKPGIKLVPGEQKVFLVVCDDTGDSGGDFRLHFGRVIEASTGTVLAENFELRYGDDGTPRDTPEPIRPAAGTSAPVVRLTPSAAVVEPTPKPVPEPTAASPSSLSQEKKRWIIAVMDVRLGAGNDKNISPQLMADIGDQLRVFIAQTGMRTVDRGTQDRVLNEQVRGLKEESYQACYDENCQIELGKALAASHVLRSNLTRFGSQCVLNAELIDLASEVSIAAASARGSCEPESFLNMSEALARRLSSG